MISQQPEHFIDVWEQEARNTIKVLKTLPVAKYDFRPDPGGRSLGELAWHLAEVDAYVSHAIDTSNSDIMTLKPPNIERPRTVEALVPGYERIHSEAVARIRKLKPNDFARRVKFFDGVEHPIEEILWNGLLHHLIHHRAQLVLMSRLAGGTPPGLYGPTREEMAAIKGKA